MPTSKSVRLANNATSTRLASLISTEYEYGDSQKCRVTLLRPAELQRTMRQAIWALFETNMHAFYLNSKILPWDPKEKRKELFHSKSRFILVRPIDPTGPLLAFSMFRFEDEEDEDAIYCYELQVTASRQGMGLGKRLINELVTLGRAFNMEKILLTVFKANINAMQIYKHIGFRLDPCSPDYVEEDEEKDPDTNESDVDYEILSLTIQ